ncbi:MAG TPA: inorganic diphosphatase [Puia sp.]|nr:inorganic diphosphatase [Puia sp.]
MKVVIETPKGSVQKYDYDHKDHLFDLRKVLPSGMMFPYDFGFIPGTQGEDGDPLDVIVISEFNSFPGCRMSCRIIGGMKAKQSGDGKTVRNDRFMAIPHCSGIFQNIKTVDDLPNDIFKQLEEFFVDYNKLEGRTFKCLGKLSPKSAEKIIEKQKK